MKSSPMLNEEQRQRLTDRHIERLLLKRENIPLLEELLAVESRKLQRLRAYQEEGKLDVGPRLNEGELAEMLREVKREVDQFLGVSGITIPPVHYINLKELTTPESRMVRDFYSVGVGSLVLGTITFFFEPSPVMRSTIPMYAFLGSFSIDNSDNCSNLYKVVLFSFLYEKR